MRWEIQWRVLGPDGKVMWTPNRPNPIESSSLSDILSQLQNTDLVIKAEKGLFSGLKIIGVKIVLSGYDSQSCP